MMNNPAAKIEESRNTREGVAAKLEELLDVADRYRKALMGMNLQNRLLKEQIEEERSRKDSRLDDLKEVVRKKDQQIEQLTQELKLYQEELSSWCKLAQQMKQLTVDDVLREAEELQQNG